MDFPENLGELSAEQLNELAAAARTELTSSLPAEPTDEQLTAAEALAANITRVETELSARTERANRAAALRGQFTATEPEPTQAENQAEVVTPEEGTGEEAADEADEAEVEQPSGEAGSQVARLAARTARPVVPAAVQAPRLSMTAASDVPGISTGGTIADIDQLSELMLSKMQSFSAPNGTSEQFGTDLRYFGLAQIKKNLPHDLTVPERPSEDVFNEILNRAVDEHRLPGNSLVASGGWCAPSEVVYDLCGGETTDGILSLPEVGLGRGGLKYTMGPDWSDIYTSAAFFAQTEAQAIAGTAKSCFEVPCPTWTDVRLDAVGICIKAPILTEAAYPELVKRWISGSLIAHQHKKNVRRISAMATALGTAVSTLKDFSTTTGSLFASLDLLASRERAVRKWAKNQTMEIILPEWAMGALRNDLSLRQGLLPGQITDQMILGEFTKRNYAPQFVYGWQELGASAVVYPNTFDVLIYKAGTFVEGTSNVINLQSVYDAASLAGNIYTALFFEEGQSIMKMCYGGLRATVATCNSGRVGIANISECNNVAG